MEQVITMAWRAHPSGDPTPSPDDTTLTARLMAAADLLEVRLLDHLIVGEASHYYSYREAGLLGIRGGFGAISTDAPTPHSSPRP